MTELIPLIVVAPLIIAAASNYLQGKTKTLKVLAVVVAVSLPLIPLTTELGSHYFGGHGPGLEYTMGIQYTLESIQKALIMLLFSITSLVLLCAVTEQEHVSGVYIYLVLMSLGASAAVLMTNDLFNLFVFMEVAAITQAGLVIALGSINSLKTALKYLLMGSVAGNLFLVGIAILMALSGGLNLGDIKSILQPTPDTVMPYLFSMGLIFFGLTYVSGLLPFHNIKALVYSNTTGSGGALLQSQGKLLFAALFIVILKLFGPVNALKILLLTFGLACMVSGIVMALASKNMFRILGYVAVSQAGLIAVGFGLLTAEGIRAALFHTVNDVIYMSALFIGFGYVHLKTERENTKDLGGLLARMPGVGLALIVCSLAAAGVPPLSGFQSELLLIKASLNAGYPELGFMIVLFGVSTLVALARLYHSVFLESNETELNQKKSSATLLALTLLALAVVAVGLMPSLVLDNIPLNDVAGWLS